MATPLTQEQNKMEFTKEDDNNNNEVKQTLCLHWVERSVLISLLISKRFFVRQSILVLTTAMS